MSARLRAPSGHGSSRELGAACRDTERDKGVTAGTPRVLRPTRPAFRARPLRLPPAAAPSAGFPPASTSSSQLCCRRCRKRRRGNRLTSPPDCARAPPGRPFGRARPLKGEWPARLTSRAPRAGGGGATAARGAHAGASRNLLAWGWPCAHLSLYRGLRGCPSPPLKRRGADPLTVG